MSTKFSSTSSHLLTKQTREKYHYKNACTTVQLHVKKLNWTTPVVMGEVLPVDPEKREALNYKNL